MPQIELTDDELTNLRSILSMTCNSLGAEAKRAVEVANIAYAVAEKLQPQTETEASAE